MQIKEEDPIPNELRDKEKLLEGEESRLRNVPLSMGMHIGGVIGDEEKIDLFSKEKTSEEQFKDFLVQLYSELKKK